jgi:molecular chaperone GrpE (heat shock protein)
LGKDFHVIEGVIEKYEAENQADEAFGHVLNFIDMTKHTLWKEVEELVEKEAGAHIPLPSYELLRANNAQYRLQRQQSQERLRARAEARERIKREMLEKYDELDAKLKAFGKPYGIELVNPKFGDQYNRKNHRLIRENEDAFCSPDKVEMLTVQKIQTRGYLVNGELRRPALVCLQD